jgi:hypothetical protein
MPLKPCQLALAFAFGVASLAAGAQQATTPPPASAPAAQSAPAAATGSKATTGATKHAAKTHRTAKKTHRTSRRTTMSESNNADSAYRAALRQCVTGPASQRDSCLDQAIARYGRA